MTYIRFVTVGLCLMFMACSPRALHEAQRVVTEADSLRETGQIYDDSAALAQSYTTLGRWQWIHADQYAHACYHYGRILRRSDDPVAAMQVFIDATHSHTTDNHILGRVYSNMGDICHLASAYPLAYDMYECSGNRYLQNGDTLLYYYALYRMAFEKAQLKDSVACLALLDSIDNYHSDSSLNAFAIMTHAELCLQCQQYDSAIYYAHKCCTTDSSTPTGILILAQSFSFLHIQDSATYYAYRVLETSNSLSDIHNALYVLTNDDQTRDENAIRQAAADRSDVQMKLKKQQGILSQAVQLLEQDLNREPDLRWLYVLIATLVIVGISCYIYVYRKRKKQRLLSQQIDVLEKEAFTMKEKNHKLSKQLRERRKIRLKQIQANCNWFVSSHEIRSHLQKGEYNWGYEWINSHFSMLADKLKKIGDFNEKDICLCIFVMEGSFTDKQLADIFYYSYKTIRSHKMNIAKRIGTTSAHFRSFLLEKAME